MCFVHLSIKIGMILLKGMQQRGDRPITINYRPEWPRTNEVGGGDDEPCLGGEKKSYSKLGQRCVSLKTLQEDRQLTN